MYYGDPLVTAETDKSPQTCCPQAGGFRWGAGEFRSDSPLVLFKPWTDGVRPNHTGTALGFLSPLTDRLTSSRNTLPDTPRATSDRASAPQSKVTLYIKLTLTATTPVSLRFTGPSLSPVLVPSASLLWGHF